MIKQKKTKRVKMARSLFVFKNASGNAKELSDTGITLASKASTCCV
jgi:hypothetical protein